MKITDAKVIVFYGEDKRKLWEAALGYWLLALSFWLLTAKKHYAAQPPSAAVIALN